MSAEDNEVGGKQEARLPAAAVLPGGALAPHLPQTRIHTPLESMLSRLFSQKDWVSCCGLSDQHTFPLKVSDLKFTLLPPQFCLKTDGSSKNYFEKMQANLSTYANTPTGFRALKTEQDLV